MIGKINNPQRVEILYSINSVLQIDGKSIEDITIESNDFCCYDHSLEKEIYINNNPFYIEIRLKNISRKRFIKLLMGKYMNKRLAEQFADFIFNRYGYYNEKFIMLF